MLQDWRGNAVTTDRPDTVAGIDAFVQGFLNYERGAAAIVPAADADPSNALANAYAAMLWLLLESPEGWVKAAPYLDRAREAAQRITPRERIALAMAEAWAGRDIPAVIRLGEQAADEHPRDLALAKITQYHAFNRGDAPGLLRVARAVVPANDDLASAHAMLAFALEECHDLRGAERAARAAMDRRASDPWAHHALAHVMLTEGRDEEADTFLSGVADTWTDLNSFMLSHNMWHLALVWIEQGRSENVMRTLWGRVWGIWKDYSQDQAGAVSLLARLELLGLEAGDRWQDVAEYLAPRVNEHVLPFLDLHYVYGLARAGRREADTLLLNLSARAADEATPSVWREVALPAAQGLVAHARGDHRVAVRHLWPVMPRLAEIGGSHAQRDLFEQILTDALIRSGHLAAAQDRLAQRLRGNPRSAPTRRRLAEVYRTLGLPQDAAVVAAAATG